MINYRVTVALAAMHRSELLAEASRARLLRDARAAAPRTRQVGDHSARRAPRPSRVIPAARLAGGPR